MIPIFRELSEALAYFNCPHCNRQFGQSGLVDATEDRQRLYFSLRCPGCEDGFVGFARITNQQVQQYFEYHDFRQGTFFYNLTLPAIIEDGQLIKRMAVEDAIAVFVVLKEVGAREKIKSSLAGYYARLMDPTVKVSLKVADVIMNLLMTMPPSLDNRKHRRALLRQISAMAERMEREAE